ncbi:hypothetical protein HYY75_04030 [bacterium]|nr:hypothetical protein [bacterium]
MKTFEVLLVEKEHKIDPASVDPDFTQKQVFVRIVVLSKDPRFPTKEVQLTSFFVTSQMSASNWNYFYD